MGGRRFCLRNWCMCLVLMQCDGRQIWCLHAFFFLVCKLVFASSNILRLLHLCTMYFFLKHVFTRTGHILRIVMKVITSFMWNTCYVICVFLRKNDKVKDIWMMGIQVSKVNPLHKSMTGRSYVIRFDIIVSSPRPLSLLYSEVCLKQFPRG